MLPETAKSRKGRRRARAPYHLTQDKEFVRQHGTTVVSVNTESHGEVETRGALTKMLDAMTTTEVLGFRAGKWSHVQRKGGPAA